MTTLVTALPTSARRGERANARVIAYTSGRFQRTVQIDASPHCMPTTEASAFWIAAPGHGELRTEVLSAAAQDEVLVHTLYSGISRGTEGLVFRGEVPVGEHVRMRAPFQQGEFPGPVKYGYASVGRVEAGPSSLAGRTVFCLFPHQTRYVLPARAVHVIPEEVPPQRAILAANMETAINGVWDADLRPGERVVVIGAGTVGSLVAWLAQRIAGCEVSLVDVNAGRASVANALGVAFATPTTALGTGAQRADKVIHASGSCDGLRLALQLAAVEATIVEMSWYGTRQVSLPLGESFHALRLTLKSSQVGSIAPAQRAQWTHDRRLGFALSLLEAPALDVLINSESAFADLPEVMPRLAGGASEVLCHRVTYPV